VDGEITKKYLWQGLTRLLAVYDGSDNLLLRFKYAAGRLPVAVEMEGATYYLAYDPVGSLRAVADASGNVVKEITYDTFGCILNDTNPGLYIPLGFAGGLHDRDTGLVRFGYRDYDPETGRWTAKDPIGFAGGSADLYGYCLNDPVTWIDPYGLQSGSPTAPGVPLFPPILPPVFYPGTPENDAFVEDVNDIIDWFFDGNEDVSSDPCSLAEEHKKKGTTNPANKEQHQKGQKRKKQKNNDKKRQKPSWQPFNQ